jgi:hypothetical protein
MRLQCRYEGYRSKLSETSNQALEKLHERNAATDIRQSQMRMYKFEDAIESVDDDESKDEDEDDDKNEDADEDAVDDKKDDEDGDTDEAEAEAEDEGEAEDEDENEDEDACAHFFARFGLRAFLSSPLRSS